jgi:hypothetical protein
MSQKGSKGFMRSLAQSLVASAINTNNNELTHTNMTEVASTDVNIQKREGLTQIQNELISALESSLGVVSTACETLGISRTNHYKWMKECPEYRGQYDDLKNLSLDYAESQLYKMIGKGNTAAVIFYLKTKGKERGYIERQEIAVSNDTPDLSGYSTSQLMDLVAASTIELPEP